MVILASACSGEATGDSTGTSTTAAPPSTTSSAPSTTAPSQTTSTIQSTASSTTVPGVVAPGQAARDGWPMADILVAADDGVSSVTTAGGVSHHLVGGDVLAAVDDTMGGIVFQLGQQHTDNGPYDQAIYWLPQGGAAPTELITVSEGLLVLHDVISVDGQPTVVYVYNDEVVGFDNQQTLHLFQIDGGITTNLGFVAGWEGGTGPISGSPGIIAYEWFAEVHSRFSFLTPTGETVQMTANPFGLEEGCANGMLVDYFTEEEHPGCPSDIAISSDGTRIAYLLPALAPGGFLTDFTLVVAGVDGTILGSVPLSRLGCRYGVDGIEISGDLVIVNRTQSEAWDAPQGSPLMIDLSTGEVRELSVVGYSRFLEAPLDTALGVEAP